ncbi:MAG: hypothetical protein IT391_06860 [Nitrospira sp.]|nr:hypothetical protein [Nitrospira sp.]
MMQHRRGLSIAGLVVSSLLGCTTGSAWAFEFSGERIVTIQGVRVAAQVNAKDDRWRFEYAYPQGSVMAAIIRQDRQTAWLLLSNRRLYLEVPIAREHGLFVGKTLDGEESRERIGVQELNGHATELFEVTVLEGAERKQYYQWVTVAEHFPLKTVSKQGDWSVEYRRVVFTEQSALIFELPQRFDRGNPPPPREETHSAQ